MTRLLLLLLLLGLVGNVRPNNVDLYLRPQYTAEGEYLKEYLRYSDVSEEEQKLLPRSLHLAFKLISPDYNLTEISQTSYQSIRDQVASTIENALDFNIKQILVIHIR